MVVSRIFKEIYLEIMIYCMVSLFFFIIIEFLYFSKIFFYFGRLKKFFVFFFLWVIKFRGLRKEFFMVYKVLF